MTHDSPFNGIRVRKKTTGEISSHSYEELENMIRNGQIDPTDKVAFSVYSDDWQYIYRTDLWKRCHLPRRSGTRIVIMVWGFILLLMALFLLFRLPGVQQLAKPLAKPFLLIVFGPAKKGTLYDPRLHQAAERGDLEEVKRLVRNGADPDAKLVDERHATPLFFAAYQGNLAIVKYLVSLGCDVNTVSYSNPECKAYTPLTVSLLGKGHIEGDHIETIKYLVSHGANPNILLVDHGRCITPLYTWVEEDNKVIINLLLEIGADPNLRSKLTNGEESDMPIHAAVRKNPNPEIVRLLIEYGANVNVHDGDGKTPLRYLYEQSNTYYGVRYASPHVHECISMLLSHGAKE